MIAGCPLALVPQASKPGQGFVLKGFPRKVAERQTSASSIVRSRSRKARKCLQKQPCHDCGGSFVSMWMQMCNLLRRHSKSTTQNQGWDHVTTTWRHNLLRESKRQHGMWGCEEKVTHGATSSLAQDLSEASRLRRRVCYMRHERRTLRGRCLVRDSRRALSSSALVQVQRALSAFPLGTAGLPFSDIRIPGKGCCGHNRASDLSSSLEAAFFLSACCLALASSVRGPRQDAVLQPCSDPAWSYEIKESNCKPAKA